MIETWNEFHEGTDIAESAEYGRQYIELTRKYSDRFKQGWKPEWPEAEYAEAERRGKGFPPFFRVVRVFRG